MYKRNKRIISKFNIICLILGVSVLYGITNFAICNKNLLIKKSNNVNKSKNYINTKASNLYHNDNNIDNAKDFINSADASGSIEFLKDDTNSTITITSSTGINATNPSFKESITFSDQPSKEYKLVNISTDAFRECSGLRGILTLPSSIEIIGKTAFYRCNELTSINFSNYLKIISEWAFADCNSLTTVSWPNNNLSEIGNTAFGYCTKLNSTIYINKSLTSIGNEAFTRCPITNIAIDDYNYKYCLADNIGNKGLLVIDYSEQTNKHWDFKTPPVGKLVVGEIDFTQSTNTNLTTSLFNSCWGLTSIIISSSLASILSNCFSYCINLQKIVWPTNEIIKMDIEHHAFYECTNLKNISFPKSSTDHFVIHEYAFMNCTNLTNIDLSGITAISTSAFKNCNLRSINIPSTLTVISNDHDIFMGNPIETIEIDSDNPKYTLAKNVGEGKVVIDKTKSIDDKWNFTDYPIAGLACGKIDMSGANIVREKCFYQNYGITSISFSESLISIGALAFYGCINLSAPLFMPNTVTTIGRNAFHECNFNEINLNYKQNQTSLSNISDKWLGSLNNPNTKVYVPFSEYNWYRQEQQKQTGNLGISECTLLSNDISTSWIDGVSVPLTLKVVDGNKSIAHIVSINDKINVTDPTINNTIIDDKDKQYTIDGLDDSLFKDQNQILGTVTIDSGITTIGHTVFTGCNNITAFNLKWNGDNLPLDGTIQTDWLDTLNTETTNIIVNSNDLNYYKVNKTKLGIDNCTICSIIDASSLIVGAKGTIKITTNGDPITPIPEILSMNLTESITNPVIDPTSFENTTGLKITDLQENLFQNNDKLLGSLTINDGITSIGQNAFENCNGLTSISLPSSLTSIGENAFNQTGINKIYLNWSQSQEAPLKANINPKWLNSVNTNTTDIIVLEKDAPWYLKIKDDVDFGINNCNIKTSDKPLDANKWIKDATSGIIHIQPTVINNVYKVASISNLIECKNPIISSSIQIDPTTTYEVHELGNELFKDQTKLTGTLTIDSAITTMGMNVFLGCSGINEIHLDWDEHQTLSLNSSWLGDTLNKPSTIVVVPFDSYDWYKQMPAISNCTIVSTVDKCSWMQQNDLSLNVKIKDSVNNILSIISIKSDIYAENPIINSQITLFGYKNYKVDELGNELFQDQTGIQGIVTIDYSIKTIGFDIFKGCKNITEIDLTWFSEIQLKQLKIDPNWLGELNKKDFKIVVPKGMVKLYKKYIPDINNCNVTDNEPIPTPANNLPLILGISLGAGIPILGATIAGIVIGIEKNKVKNHTKKTNKKKKK